MATVEAEVSPALLVDQYVEAKKAENAAKARVAKLRSQLLGFVGDNPENTPIPFSGIHAGVTVTFKDTSHFSNDIVDFLKERGYTEALKMTVDPDKLNALLDLKLIQEEDVAPYWVEESTPTLNVNK